MYPLRSRRLSPLFTPRFSRYSKPVDNGTRWDGNLVPQCIPCSRLNGYYMSGSSFVNISEYLDMGYIHDPTRACAAGYQCVAEDPYDALPDYDRDFSKTPGCCQKCLNGQSCPPMTVAATGYYFDNLCPDGFKCEVGEWPVPCEIGEMCYKGVQINCSMVVESVRGGGSALGAVEGVGDTVDNFNSNGMSVSTNSSEGKAVGFLDGAYCPGGANLEWCPGGFYCPSPDQVRFRRERQSRRRYSLATEQETLVARSPFCSRSPYTFAYTFRPDDRMPGGLLLPSQDALLRVQVQRGNLWSRGDV